jgi:hypothetical protein
VVKGINLFLILVFCWITGVFCNQKGNGQKSMDKNQVETDTIIKLNYLDTAFKQPVRNSADLAGKKFVRITTTQIVNPAKITLSFELYWIVGDKSEFLGSVAPFPSDNPGSYIIATSGKLRTDGQLELKLVFSGELTNKEKVQVSFNKLQLE